MVPSVGSGGAALLGTEHHQRTAPVYNAPGARSPGKQPAGAPHPRSAAGVQIRGTKQLKKTLLRRCEASGRTQPSHLPAPDCRACFVRSLWQQTSHLFCLPEISIACSFFPLVFPRTSNVIPWGQGCVTLASHSRAQLAFISPPVCETPSLPAMLQPSSPVPAAMARGRAVFPELHPESSSIAEFPGGKAKSHRL